MSKKFFLCMAGLLFWLMPLAAEAEEPADGGDKSNGFIFNESGYDPSVSGAVSLPETETVYTAGGGQIIWSPNLDGEGKVVSGTLTLKNAVINNNSSNPETNYGSGIWMSVPFELVLEGDNRITATGYGILLPDSEHSGAYDLRIRGSGSLTVDSQRQGILADGAITMDAVNLTVTYGFGSGIISEYRDITIENGSHVTVKSSDSVSSSGGAIQTNNSGDIIIKNSHVIAINRVGTAVSANGNVRFESSDVRTLGTTWTVTCENAGSFTVNGGSLYTKGNGGYDLPFQSDVKLENSAVIYCGGGYNYLVQQGDSIQYANCIYDEAADQITSVGDGNVYGNVTWNEYVRFPLGQSKRLFVGMGGSTLTIPEGVTAEIPDGATLRNSYSGSASGALINYGTLNILDGGTLYNFDESNGNHKVTAKNYGTINLAPTATFFNTALLENKGMINSEGNIRSIQVYFDNSPYNGVIQNTGTINGFVSEQKAGLLLYRAEGNTVLKNGQTLTLGTGTANSGKWDTNLEIPANGSLTIAAGAVVDAKEHVTKETLLTYLKAGGTLKVDTGGTLLLPEEAPEEALEELAQFITGEGTIKAGDTVNYLVTFDLGDGSTQKKLLAENSSLTLLPDPVRKGYTFEGWYVKPEGEEIPADPETMTVTENMTVYARWKAVETDPDENNGEDNSGENNKPDDSNKPGGNTGAENGSDGNNTNTDNKDTAGNDTSNEGSSANGSHTSSGGSNSDEMKVLASSSDAGRGTKTGDTANIGGLTSGLIFSLVLMVGIAMLLYKNKKELFHKENE